MQQKYTFIQQERLLQQRWQHEFLEAIYHFQKTRAQELLNQAFQYYSSEDVCLYLIQPVLYRIGYLWKENKISWINENFASTLIYSTMRQKIQEIPQPATGPLVFMSCVPEETHEIGLLMLALFWKRAGLRITYNSPVKSTSILLRSIRQVQPAIVCLSVAAHRHAKILIPISHVLAKLPSPQPLLCYGGGAFIMHNKYKHQIQGLYLGADAAIATQMIQQLLRKT